MTTRGYDAHVRHGLTALTDERTLSSNYKVGDRTPGRGHRGIAILLDLRAVPAPRHCSSITPDSYSCSGNLLNDLTTLDAGTAPPESELDQCWLLCKQLKKGVIGPHRVMWLSSVGLEWR